MGVDQYMLALSKPHPLRTEWTTHPIQPNQSLADVVVAAQPDPILRRFAHVYLDGELIQSERWSMIQPRIGQEVQIVATLGGGEGGGKNPLRTILSLGILIVGTVFGGPLGGLIGLSGTWATAVGTALIAFGGTALVNAIAPIRPASGHEEDRQSPNYFIDRARNRSRPFDAVPTVLGRHRMVPPLAGDTYTEALGDKQFLRMLVTWGYGRLRVNDLQIGETAITAFQRVHVQTREGMASDEPITLYPSDVHEERLNVHLTEAAGWTTRTTEPAADEISVDFSLPRGMSAFDDQGKRSTLSVEIQIEYREVGESAWLSPPFTREVDQDVEIERDDPWDFTFEDEWEQEEEISNVESVFKTDAQLQQDYSDS